MLQISVVIICKNEARVIGNTLKSLSQLTDDVIVYDNGSTDETVMMAKEEGAQVFIGEWEGFGKTKMKANSHAKYDWILSLDADESIDEELKETLLSMKLGDANSVYKLRFRNYLGDKMLKYGEWGNDMHIRIFNRQMIHWSNDAVHEKLILPSNTDIRIIRKGYVHHRTMKDLEDYSRKMITYAMLSADKYYSQGKRSSWIKIRLSPLFNFLNYYIFRLGFLDGHEGFVCAKMTAHYTFLKYARLKEKWQENK
jgi:glycosyltransferase involved in cell wall biosynthesis